MQLKDLHYVPAIEVISRPSRITRSYRHIVANYNLIGDTASTVFLKAYGIITNNNGGVVAASVEFHLH